jgi:hypothetical protein
MPRANLYDADKKIIITLNYKCASSNIIRWFVSNMKDYKHENTTLSNIINKKYVFSDGKIGNYKGYYKILIVRNPFNRLVSAFLDKGFYNFGPLIRLCEKYKLTIGDLTFRKFINILSKENIKDMNSHWRPLSSDNNPLKYDKVIKMEFIGNHMNVFAKRFQYTEFPVKTKISKKISKNLYDVPIKDLKLLIPSIHRNYKNYFDKQIIENVEKIFKGDLLMFNYSYKRFLLKS